MNTVYRYPLDVPDDAHDDVIVLMPEGATIVRVGVKRGEGACMWALVDTARTALARTFRVCGTGEPVPEIPSKALTYVGSVDIEHPTHVFVGHVLEVVSGGE